MPDRILEEFLDSVCDGIPARETAQEVRFELLDHLESRIDEYMSGRYDRSSAARKAIEDMGEKEQIREQLAHLHHRIPYFDLKNALGKIILGLLLQFFSLNFWILTTVSSSIGVCLLFAGMLQLRAINKELQKGWILSTFLLIYTLAVNILQISPLVYLDPTLFSSPLILAVPAVAILFVFLCFFGKGLTEILERPADPKETSVTRPEDLSRCKRISQIQWLYLASFVVAVLGTMFADVMLLWVILFAIPAGILLLRIYRVQTLFLTYQRGYGAIHLEKKTRIVIFAAGFSYVLLPFALSLVLFLIPRSFWYEEPISDSVDFQRVEDVVGKSDGEAILAAMTANTTPLYVIESLPEEEIANISGTTEYAEGINAIQGMDTGVEASYILCRKKDHTIYQTVIFSLSGDANRGGWDSVLLPSVTYGTEGVQSNSRVYIIAEDADGKHYLQQPIAVRYGSRTQQRDNRQIRDAVCVDYAVSDPKSRQWVVICSSIPDDDGTGNPFLFEKDTTAISGTCLNPLEGYAYVRRSLWLPTSYNDSVRVKALMPNDLSVEPTIGFTRINVIPQGGESSGL